MIILWYRIYCELIFSRGYQWATRFYTVLYPLSRTQSLVQFEHLWSHDGKIMKHSNTFSTFKILRTSKDPNTFNTLVPFANS